MDHTHNDRASIQQNDHSLNNRALVVTSGNKQVYTSDKHGPFKGGQSQGKRYHNGHHGNGLAFSSRFGGTAFPIPRSILGSNDRGAALRQTIAHRRLWQRLNAPRPYLSHPAYIKYRNRPRKDTDKSGEVIWTDEVEEAFQDALVCIPPMGKKKKSQNGKPHGRNELVSEWIFHETGLRLCRRRKQVSSHLQVLDNFLRDVPEWQAVRRESATNAKNSSDSAADYYFNSVEEVVREVQRMKTEPFYKLQYMEDEQLLKSNEMSLQRLRLREVDFGMWVSLPDKMDNPLHRYTTLRSNLPEHMFLALDDIPNWQSRFPNLDPLMQAMSSVDDFDVILLDVRLRLMEDFPPESSKLGISLGLGFAMPNIQPTQNQGNSKAWVCTTHIHQSGKTVCSAERKQCPISGSRMIKPPFESKWWAFEFTRLTDERRRAQDMGDETAVIAADASARDYLQNLSVMQEISTIPDDSLHPNPFWPETEARQERMAVLLWRFSAALPGETGITTWKRVTPPAVPDTTNCVVPVANVPTDLPLTMLHGAMEDLPQAMYGVTPGYEYAMIHANHSYSPASDEELCQDGFTMIGQQDAYNTANGSLHHVSNSINSAPSSFNIVHDFGSIEPSQHLIDYDHLTQEDTGSQPTLLDKYFNHDDQLRSHENLVSHPELPQSSFQMIYDRELQSTHGPLHNFDTSTHKMLQEQLGSFGEESKIDAINTESTIPTQGECLHQARISEVDEEALKEALIAASAVEEIEAHKQAIPSTSGLDESSSVTSQAGILAPIAVRPLLQHHHSFAGVFPPEPSYMFDVPRHDVAQLLARMEASQECFSAVLESTAKDAGYELVRAHSQPEFPTKKSDNHAFTLGECIDEEYAIVAHQDPNQEV